MINVVPEGWSTEKNCLKRQFEFADFKQALQFMNKVGAEAERLNHHPDWSNSYNKVSISLMTHSSGDLTDKDFALAKVINKIAAQI